MEGIGLAELIVGTLLAFFAIVGAAEICRAVSEFLYSPRGGRVCCVVSLGGHEEQTEYLLRSLISEARSGPLSRCGPRVVVIDRGMDEETKEICRLLSEECGCIEVCQSGERALQYLET